MIGTLFTTSLTGMIVFAPDLAGTSVMLTKNLPLYETARPRVLDESLIINLSFVRPHTPEVEYGLIARTRQKQIFYACN